MSYFTGGCLYVVVLSSSSACGCSPRYAPPPPSPLQWPGWGRAWGGSRCWPRPRCPSAPAPPPQLHQPRHPARGRWSGSAPASARLDMAISRLNICSIPSIFISNRSSSAWFTAHPVLCSPLVRSRLSSSCWWASTFRYVDGRYIVDIYLDFTLYSWRNYMTYKFVSSRIIFLLSSVSILSQQK